MLRKINDVLIYAMFCFLCGTGFMMKFSFVKGAGIQTVIGLSKPEWETLHLYAGVIMLVGVVIHLLLNRKFIENALCAKSKIAAAIFALVGAAIILGLALFPN